MYLDMWNFKKNPFDNVSAYHEIFKSESVQKALAQVQYGIEHNKELAVFTGDFGSGKTRARPAQPGESGRSEKAHRSWPSPRRPVRRVRRHRPAENPSDCREVQQNRSNPHRNKDWSHSARPAAARRFRADLSAKERAADRRRSSAPARACLCAFEFPDSTDEWSDGWSPGR